MLSATLVCLKIALILGAIYLKTAGLGSDITEGCTKSLSIDGFGFSCPHNSTMVAFHLLSTRLSFHFFFFLSQRSSLFFKKEGKMDTDM